MSMCRAVSGGGEGGVSVKRFMRVPYILHVGFQLFVIFLDRS